MFGRALGRVGALAFMLSVAGCGDPEPAGEGGADGEGGSGEAAAPGNGGFGGAEPSDGGGGAAAEVSGTAPQGTLPGESAGVAGDNAVGSDSLLRFELDPSEHVTFFLAFDESWEGVELELLRWSGSEVVSLGFTDGGAGLRTLAAFDASDTRTFWVRVSSLEEGFAGSLAVTRRQYADGPSCTSQCDELIQLPMRNDPAYDGYDWTPSTVFRYQYGRRDLVMMFRWAARQMAIAGRSPVYPEDFSQWNGETPGADVGSLRHASHQRGKDVDISLYGDDGLASWRSYCETEYTSDGRECVAGSAANFDGRSNAEMFAAMLQSERVTMSFLDRELIPQLVDGAEEAAGADAIDGALVPLYGDGQHVQHWPNHDNHIHVRVSELEYGASALAPEPFEAP